MCISIAAIVWQQPVLRNIYLGSKNLFLYIMELSGFIFECVVAVVGHQTSNKRSNKRLIQFCVSLFYTNKHYFDVFL